MSRVDGERAVAAALLVPEAAVPAGLRVPSGVAVEGRFAVHRNTFVVTLVDAMAGIFPVTEALLGHECFRSIARQRVLADPPQTPVVVEYARGFPRYLANCEATVGLPWLADVARLESLCAESFHAADGEPVEPARFGSLVTDPAGFSRTRALLHPATRWMSSRHAAYSLWAAHQHLADRSAAELDTIDVECAEDVLVCRVGFAVRVHRLPPGALVCLRELSEGSSIARAFGEARARDPRADPASIFTLLIAHGLVSGLVSTDEELP